MLVNLLLISVMLLLMKPFPVVVVEVVERLNMPKSMPEPDVKLVWAP